MVTKAEQDAAATSTEVLMRINDSLVYVDEEVSEAQRLEVNRMINQEVAQMDITQPHPALTNRFEMANAQSFSIMKDLYDGDEDDEEGSFSPSSIEEDNFSIGGIDTTKYSNLTTEDNQLNYDNLYASLAHSVLRKRSLTMSNISREVQKNKWLMANDNLEATNTELESQLHTKRKAIEEINLQRKKQQSEYSTTDSFLRSRWEQSLRGCVDVGVECAKIELEQIEKE